MTAEVANLLWRGAATVDAAKAALARGARSHHAIGTRFHAACAAGAQAVDVEGGAELLTRLAAIPRPEARARLETPVKHAQARIHVASPTLAIVRRRDRTGPAPP